MRMIVAIGSLRQMDIIIIVEFARVSKVFIMTSTGERRAVADGLQFEVLRRKAVIVKLDFVYTARFLY